MFKQWICGRYINDLAEAKSQLTSARDREAQLRAEMDELLKPEVLPEVAILEMTWKEMVADLSALGLDCMLKDPYGLSAPDTTVRYTDVPGWDLIVPHVLESAEHYVAEFTDCDDYAKRGVSNISFKFNLNGAAECWGDSPLARHGFVLVVTGRQQFRLFEPNAGFIPYYIPGAKTFGDGEYGYRARQWKV